LLGRMEGGRMLEGLREKNGCWEGQRGGVVLGFVWMRMTVFGKETVLGRIEERWNIGGRQWWEGWS
jgi:hypothetical protein